MANPLPYKVIRELGKGGVTLRYVILCTDADGTPRFHQEPTVEDAEAWIATRQHALPGGLLQEPKKP